MLHRERPEKEYAPLYKNYGMGTTVFSALQSGILTGKYNDGIPPESRFSNEANGLSHMAKQLSTPEGQEKIRKVRELTKIAEGILSSPLTTGQEDLTQLHTELQTSVSALALAWVARNPNTSTVILGASRPEQVLENLKALEVLPKLTEELMGRIEEVLDNKPEPQPTYGRPALDPMGRF